MSPSGLNQGLHSHKPYTQPTETRRQMLRLIPMAYPIRGGETQLNFSAGQQSTGKQTKMTSSVCFFIPGSSFESQIALGMLAPL